MKYLTTMLSVLGSKALTLLFAGTFLIYYLSIATWSSEAFASFVAGISSNALFRFGYILILLNLVLRLGRALSDLRRHPAAGVLRLPLYAGLLLALFSFFMSVNMRVTTNLLVSDGNRVEIPWEKTQYRVERIESALEKHALRDEKPVIFDYEPGIALADDAGGRYEVKAFPPTRLRSTYIHVLNFGIAPGVELRHGGHVIADGNMPLRLVPYGSMDDFQLDPAPFKFTLGILPTRVVRKGTAAGREYDLLNPRYSVEIHRGTKMVARGETEKRFAFDDGFELLFSPPTDWVLLEAVSDPFLPWFVASLVLVVSGIAVYPFSYLFIRG